jgi:hypothetical protein
VTLAQHTIGPPEGEEWTEFLDGQLPTYHLRVIGHVPERRACSMPARGRVEIGGLVLCATCAFRALNTRDAKEHR